MKVLLISLAVVVVVRAVPQHTSADEYDPQDPPRYEFEYGVQADETNYGQQEARDGESTAGSYKVLLPDSRTQTVNYRIDGDGGYQADVKYDGQAVHDGEYAAGGSPKSYEPKPSRVATATKAAPRHISPSTQAYESPEPKRSYGMDTSDTSEPLASQGYGAPEYKAERIYTTQKPVYARLSATQPPVSRSVRITTKPAYASTTTYRPKTTAPSGRERAVVHPEPSVYSDNKLRFARVPSDIYDKPLFRSEVEKKHKGMRPGAKIEDEESGHRGEQADPADDTYVKASKATLDAYKALEESEKRSNFGAKLSSFSDSTSETEEPEEEYYPTYKTDQ